MWSRIFEALFAKAILWVRDLFELDDLVGTRCENCAEVILRNHWGMPYPVCRGCFDAMWHSKDEEARYAFFMTDHPKAEAAWRRRISVDSFLAADEVVSEERQAALDCQAQMGRKILANRTDGVAELMERVKGHLIDAGVIEKAMKQAKEDTEGKS